VHGVHGRSTRTALATPLPSTPLSSGKAAAPDKPVARRNHRATRTRTEDQRFQFLALSIRSGGHPDTAAESLADEVSNGRTTGNSSAGAALPGADPGGYKICAVSYDLQIRSCCIDSVDATPEHGHRPSGTLSSVVAFRARGSIKTSHAGPSRLATARSAPYCGLVEHVPEASSTCTASAPVTASLVAQRQSGEPSTARSLTQRSTPSHVAHASQTLAIGVKTGVLPFDYLSSAPGVSCCLQDAQGESDAGN
jgi:hypothetical protein